MPLRILTVLLLSCVVLAQPQPTFIFPLDTGTTWVYSGSVRWTVDNTVRKAVVLRTMEVVDSRHGPGFDIALVQGAPSDVYESWAGTGPRTTRPFQLIARFGNDFFIRSGTESELRTMFSALDPGRPRDLLGDPFFSTPLKLGTVVCDPEEDAQYDPQCQAIPCQNRRAETGMYCWHVEDARTRRLAIKGVPARTIAEYDYAYRTNPDHQLFRFASGIGITHWESIHHGTVDEAIMDLVEFHPAPQKRLAK